MNLPPIKIPDLHLYSGRNPRMKPTSYARRWIQANAWLGIGDPVMARHALRELNYFKLVFPYRFEYWQDVGLVCELNGEAKEAGNAYGTAASTKRVYLSYLNWDAFTTPPVIAEAPDVHIPAFSAYEIHPFAGSLFTLAAQLVSECSQAQDDDRREHAGRAAERHLTTCMNRGIRPELARALRGRTRYYLNDLESAETDLRHACDVLSARGEPDAGSLLVLGTLLYQDKRIDESIPFLQQAVNAEPDFAGPWRTLGAALAAVGRDGEALAAMDRAIELEPGSSHGWHNRGYFHAAHGDPARAAVDLGVALRIAPGNAATLVLSQRVAQELSEADRDEDVLRALALSDSLAAGIPSVAEGRFESRPATITLGAVADRTQRTYRPVDYEALADSLGAVLGPETPLETRRRLAEAYLHCDRPEEVTTLLDPTAAAAPEDLVLLLRADRARGEPQRALDLVRSQYTCDHAELWSLVALTCLDHEYPDEGMWALERALELDPRNDGLRRYREFLVSGR